jgi:hypothetical protein
MDPSPSRSPFVDALLDAAKRTSTDEFRRLIAWVKRAASGGFVPPGVTIADALDLEIRALRHGRCAVPYCSRRVSRAKPPRPGRGRPPDADPENRFRLCRAHRGLLREGLLRVEGTPETPRFFGRVGGEIRYRD